MQVAAFLIFANNLVAQTLQIDGRYYAESSRVRLEAEINRNNILIRSFYFLQLAGSVRLLTHAVRRGLVLAIEFQSMGLESFLVTVMLHLYMANFPVLKIESK